MNYKEAREYINGLELSDEMNLQAISTLLGRLGNPQQDLKFIHVAGTNGKGSFISYITSILGSAGYRVGKYTSPAIFEELETIQVNGKNISEMDFAQYVTRIAQVISEMKTDDEPVPSPFEVETVISFMYFKDCNCDIVVLEAGLGGKLDATNVIDTVLMEVFMPIALDHVDYLGSTVEDVALAKSGIIKRSTDVISSVQSAEVKAILEKVAKENEASIEFLNTDDIY
ncbi:MAG: bifunctional folylpolyglutamate synthase/dihydrofolate synthase, partial [Christensenellales bacterium]